MTALGALRASSIGARPTPARPRLCCRPRAVLRPEDWSSGDSDMEGVFMGSSQPGAANVDAASAAELDTPATLDRSPVTGNPQTGKLVDVYFEVGAMLLVVLLAGLSYLNAHHVISQTAQADGLRMPAARDEWLARDNQNVYGPCGPDQESGEAMRALLEGRPCTPAAFHRAPPATQRSGGGAAQ